MIHTAGISCTQRLTVIHVSMLLESDYCVGCLVDPTGLEASYLRMKFADKRHPSKNSRTNSFKCRIYTTCFARGASRSRRFISSADKEVVAR